MYEMAKHTLANHGVLVDNLRIDLGKMMAQKETAVAGLTKGIEGLFKKNKVAYVKGAGKLSATKGEVIVTAADGSTSILRAKNILLAAGSEVRALGAPSSRASLTRAPMPGDAAARGHHRRGQGGLLHRRPLAEG